MLDFSALKKTSIPGLLRDNLLAAALRSVNSNWNDIFTRVPYEEGETLVFRGGRPSYIYFPINGMVSILVNPSLEEREKGDKGDQLQAAMLGTEDCVGIQGLLGTSLSTYNAVADIGGQAWRASAEAARRLLATDEKSRAIVMLYVDLQLAEAWQTAGSAMDHGNEARVATWMLRVSRVLGSNYLPVTHIQMSRRMGIRRPSVTNAVQALEVAGVVKQHGRGRIDLVDLDQLTALAERTWPLMVSHRKEFRGALEQLVNS